MKIKKFESYQHNRINGNYLELEEVEDGLWLHLTDDGREELESKDEASIYDIYDLFDDIRSNSDYLFHEDLGEAGFGMTDAPGLTSGYYYNDSGTDYECEEDMEGEYCKIYWYPNYVVKDIVEELLDKGKVFFQDSESKEERSFRRSTNKFNL